MFGWLLGHASMWQRGLLLVSALCLIKPGLITDAIGLALLALVATVQVLERRKAGAATQETA
ncbi:FxsA cytoplasmic membrane protein [compost metagenome]